MLIATKQKMAATFLSIEKPNWIECLCPVRFCISEREFSTIIGFIQSSN